MTCTRDARSPPARGLSAAPKPPCTKYARIAYKLGRSRSTFNLLRSSCTGRRTHHRTVPNPPSSTPSKENPLYTPPFAAPARTSQNSNRNRNEHAQKPKSHTTMSATEEATINPDGTQTMGGDAYAGAANPGPEADAMGGDDAGADADADDDFTGGGEEGAEEALKDAVEGTDPAIYLLLAFFFIAGLWYYFYLKKKRDEQSSDSFFSEMDGEKFNLKLPASVQEYYEVKAKCEAAGWEPGQLVSFESRAPVKAATKQGGGKEEGRNPVPWSGPIGGRFRPCARTVRNCYVFPSRALSPHALSHPTTFPLLVPSPNPNPQSADRRRPRERRRPRAAPTGCWPRP